MKRTLVAMLLITMLAGVSQAENWPIGVDPDWCLKRGLSHDMEC